MCSPAMGGYHSSNCITDCIPDIYLHGGVKWMLCILSGHPACCVCKSTLLHPAGVVTSFSVLIKSKQLDQVLVVGDICLCTRVHFLCITLVTFNVTKQTMIVCQQTKIAFNWSTRRTCTITNWCLSWSDAIAICRSSDGSNNHRWSFERPQNPKVETSVTQLDAIPSKFMLLKKQLKI